MISLIVAYDKNRCIGNDNTIPWRLKADMKRVKELTTNQTIIMGRKTFESIGRPLPNRVNRILTTNFNYVVDGAEVFTSDIKILSNVTTDKIFIFGGSKIYEHFIDKVEEMFITEVDTNIEGDSYFPEIDLSSWELISSEQFYKDEHNEYNYKFLHYKK